MATLLGESKAAADRPYNRQATRGRVGREAPTQQPFFITFAVIRN